MFFVLFVTISSFKINKFHQELQHDHSKAHIIDKSNFQIRPFSHANPDNKYKYNKLSNSLVSNSNFKIQNSKGKLLSMIDVLFINNTIDNTEVDSTEPDFQLEGPITIYNFTLINARSTNSDSPIFQLNSPELDITKFYTKGTTMATLFSGSVSSFSMRESYIQNFQKNTEHNAKAAIILNKIKSDSLELTFENNTYQNNEIPVFLIDAIFKNDHKNNYLISRGIFYRNTATNGSCIYIAKATSNQDPPKVIIEECTFTENTNENLDESYKGLTGGALILSTSNSEFKADNYFYRNKVHYYGEESTEYGAFGASIFLYQSKAEAYTVSNLHFEGDYTTNSGASFFLYATDQIPQAKGFDINLVDCTFKDGLADFNGGAFATGIVMQEGETTKGTNDVVFTRCTFTNCEASYRGGAIYTPLGTKSGDELTKIDSCEFDNCRASLGCAVYSSTYLFDLIGTTFKNQTDQYTSENVYLLFGEEGADIVITNCTFSTSKHTAIRISEDSKMIKKLSFEQCTFIENEVTVERNSESGVIDFDCLKSHELSLIECNFTSNKGYSVYAKDGICDTNVENCRFENNTGTKGCAIYIDESLSGNEYITITDCQFIGNTVEVEKSGRASGAVYAPYGVLKFSETNTFTSNKADFKGDSSSILKRNCAFGGSLVYVISSEANVEVSISGLVFSEGSSTNYGGAIAIDYSSKLSKSINVSFSFKNCNFAKCSSVQGGSIFINENDKVRNEVVNINNCKFDDCQAKDGSSIYCTTDQIKIKGSTFENNKNAENTLICVYLVGKNCDSEIEDSTFSKNSQQIKLISRTTGDSIEIDECHFLNYNEEETDLNNAPVVHLDLIRAENVLFEECEFKSNKGQCIVQDGWIDDEIYQTYNTNISKCRFLNNQGGGGCAIMAMLKSDDHKMVIKDCTFQSNKVVFANELNAGVVWATAEGVEFHGVNKFLNNELYIFGVEDESQMTIGGSLLIAQNHEGDPKEYLIKDMIFENSYSADFGGALGIFATDFLDTEQTPKTLFISIDNCTFKNCSSKRQGGAIKCGLNTSQPSFNLDNDVKITNCKFTDCRSELGGALYFLDGDELGNEETVIQGCTFTECSATKDGSTIYCRSYSFSMSDTTFDNIRGGSESSLLYINLDEKGLTPEVTNCTFTNNNETIKFISGTSKSKESSITFKGCHFTHNDDDSILHLGIIRLEYIQSGTVTFDECIFNENNGRCIVQERESICNTTIKSCTFEHNEGHSGVAICTIGKADGHIMIVEDCTFENNKVQDDSLEYHTGAVHAYSRSIEFRGVNEFISNEAYSREGATDEMEMSIGGSLFIFQESPEEYTISNLVFRDSYSEHFGGAVGLFSGDSYEPDEKSKHLFIRLENCTFTNCTSGSQGGAIKCGLNSKDSQEYTNDVSLVHCSFTNCQSNEGGALYFMDGDELGDEETVIEYCTFDGCTAAKEGSSLFCRSYNFSMSHTIFQNIKGQEGSLMYVSMDENGHQPNINNCTFYNNNQKIKFISGDEETLYEGSSITFSHCNFTHNIVGETGGSFSLLQLQYIQSEQVTIEYCLFDQNGGNCVLQEYSTSSDTYVYECTFSNNNGYDGCAIYTDSGNNHKVIVENCHFLNNIVSNPSGGIYGVVFADSRSIQFLGNNEFIGNELHSPDPSETDEFQMSTGGSLFIIQNEPAEYPITNVTFKDSYSDHFGGALVIYAGDVEGTSFDKNLFIHIYDCTFTNCSSGRQGGAIKCGMNSTSQVNHYDNDVRITNCQFIDCKSAEGGALYFRDGDKEGDEETVIEQCTFDGCSATEHGSSLFCRSYKFSLTDTIFKNMKGQGSLMYVKMDENGHQPNISNCTFYNNDQRIEFISGNETSKYEGSSITFSHCNFTHNNIPDPYPTYSLLQLQYIQSERVTIEYCLFDQNGGECILQETYSICDTYVYECTFSNNNGLDGCAIFADYVKGRKVIVENCHFLNNIVSNAYAGYYGIVYADSRSIQFLGNNEFIGNEIHSPNPNITDEFEMSSGGSLFIFQKEPANYPITNVTFKDSYSDYLGGALIILAGDVEDTDFNKSLSIHIYDCTFTNCSSGRQGGAVKCGLSSLMKKEHYDNDVRITNCQFINCKSAEGGALYFRDGDKEGDEETVIEQCIFDGCSATEHGSSLFCRSYKFSLTDTIFKNMKGQGSLMYVNMDENGLQPNISNCTFYNNDQQIEFISGNEISKYKGSSITFSHCNFTHNNIPDPYPTYSLLQLQYIQSERVTIEYCLFDQNGGECILQENYSVCDTYVYECTFSNNIGFDGCAIFADSANDHKVIVENCHFLNNRPSGYYGVVYADSKSIQFLGNNEFIGNELRSPMPSIDDEEHMSKGGSLFIIQNDPAEFPITNVTFKDCYSDHLGGALVIFAGDIEGKEGFDKNLFIHVYDCTFTNCSSGRQGGAIKCGLNSTWKTDDFSNDVRITNCQFIDCKSAEGGALYFRDGDKEGDEETIIEYCTFDGCSATKRGSSLFCRSYKLSLLHSIFKNMKGEGTLMYANLDERESQPKVTNCSFTNNDQYIEFISGSSSPLSQSSITFSNCYFAHNCEGYSGTFSVMQVQFIQSGTVNIENCLFEHNGGQCIMQDSDIICNTHVYKCNFTENTGFDGCAIATMVASNQYKMTVEDCIFRDNRPTEPTAGWYGAVIAYSNAIEFRGENQFINNQVTADDPGIWDDEVAHAFGGSLFIMQVTPEEYTVSGITFTDSYSNYYGGAIAIFGGDYFGGDEYEKSLFIRIENCKFTNCSSDKQGGAIKCGLNSSWAQEYHFSNDVCIAGCVFTNCRSELGGALYFLDGDELGDEETVIQGCTFTECSATKDGSTIYCRSYSFSMSDTTFDNIRGGSESSLLYINLDEKGLTPEVTNCTFTNNNEIIKFISGTSKSKESSITFKGCHFTHNNDESADYSGILQLDYIQSGTVTFDECIFNENNGRCISQGWESICNTTIKSCTFEHNEGHRGVAIWEITKSDDHVMIVEDCTFKNNKVRGESLDYYYGAVYAYSRSIEFRGVNEFISNEAYSREGATDEMEMSIGGSLFIFQESPEEYTISNLVFRDSYSEHFGGAVGLFSGDYYDTGIEGPTKKLFIRLENCTFTNCTSGSQGGAIKCGLNSKDSFEKHTNDVSLVHCIFTNCQSNEGGALYFMDGDELGDEETVIEYCTFDGCTAAKEGSSLFCRSYKLSISHTIFQNMKGEGSLMYVNLDEDEVTSNVTNCTFTHNDQYVAFKSGHSESTGNSITFKECHFTHNCENSYSQYSVLKLEHIQSGRVTFEECDFKENGGRCINQESNTVCDTHIYKCLFERNTGLDGCAIWSFSHSNTHKITVEDCTFKENSPTSTFSYHCGTILAFSTLIEFVGRNEFIDNEIKLTSPPSGDEDFEKAYGSSLFIFQDGAEEYSIRGLVFTNCHSEHYGGAIGILAGDYTGEVNKSNLFIRIEDCEFNNCTAGVQGGALKCGLKGEWGNEAQYTNDVSLIGCTFNGCESPEGGALYFMDGNEIGDEETVIQYCTFDGCRGSKGSAVYCRSYKLLLEHTIFMNSVNPDNDEDQSVLYVHLDERGIKPNVTNCTFFNNEQGIYFVSLDKENLNHTNSITFTLCNFSSNNILSNGYDSIMNLQYLQSDILFFEDCVFENNRGHCLRQETDTICKTHLLRCRFEGNQGGTGCAIYAPTTTQDNKPFMTIEDCVFSNNKVESSWSPKGGAVYGTTISLSFIGRNQFISNQAVLVKNEGASTLSFNEGSCGGSLFLVQDKDTEFMLSNLIFKDSHSSDYGGALAIRCAPEIEKLYVDILSCTFDNCSSTTGGSFCSTIEGTFTVHGCRFFNNKAENGADIYCTDDSPESPSTLTVLDCIFSNSAASDTGGSIYCVSGNVDVSGNNFTNCSAQSKAAAMYLSAYNNATFQSNNIEMDKKSGVSAIYYTSQNENAVIWLDGGCYSTSSKTDSDKSADILVFESPGKIMFQNEPCFSGTKNESIQFIGNVSEELVNELPDSYFSCDKCSPIVIQPTPTITMPIRPDAPTTKPSTRPTRPSKPPTRTPSLSPTMSPSLSPEMTIQNLPSQSWTSEPSGDNSGKGKKKLTTGAIVGIVIGAVVVVALIIFLCVFFLVIRRNDNNVVSEQISREINSTYGQESQLSANSDSGRPIWAANSIDGNASNNPDPFMNDFEEAAI